MAAYDNVRGGQLKVKGDWLKKKKKNKRKKNDDDELLEWMKEPGAVKHGKFTSNQLIDQQTNLNISHRIRIVVNHLSQNECVIILFMTVLF